MLSVRDMARMTAFVSAISGEEPLYASPHFTSFALGEARLGLHLGGSGGQGQNWRPCVCVAEIDAFLAQVEKTGGQKEAGPHETPRGPVYDFRDPEGNPWQAIVLS